MSNKLLPWLLLACALGLSSTAAYYSVVGLSIVFSGVAIPVIIMGSFLEASKLIIATYLHNQWKKTYRGLKIYLTSALIFLSIITSIGIYGLLSKGFQANIAKLEISSKQVANIELKKERFESSKQDYLLEKQTLDSDVSQLREALSTGTTTQYKDRETGQIITINSSSARKTFEKQLESALEDKDILSKKIETLNDSITNLDLKILDMETSNTESNELGVIQSVSEITGLSLNVVANIFILLLIIVFDPLAITLVISTNQAFENSKKNLKSSLTVVDPPQPPLEPKSEEPPSQPKEYTVYGENPHLKNIDSRIQALYLEQSKIQNSSLSERKRIEALNRISSQIRDLNNQKDNQKTY